MLWYEGQPHPGQQGWQLTRVPLFGHRWGLLGSLVLPHEQARLGWVSAQDGGDGGGMVRAHLIPGLRRQNGKGGSCEQREAAACVVQRHQNRRGGGAKAGGRSLNPHLAESQLPESLGRKSWTGEGTEGPGAPPSRGSTFGTLKSLCVCALSSHLFTRSLSLH